MTTGRTLLVMLRKPISPKPSTCRSALSRMESESCWPISPSNLTSPALGWAYTVNHAHMLPEGIAGFAELFDLRRCGEVRIADNRGDKEEHLRPGEGTIDFRALFDRLEGAGYDRHYMMAFGSMEDMRAGRETLIRLADRVQVGA